MSKTRRRHHRRGFSLVELATAIAITTILVGLTVPAVVRMVRHNILETATRSIMGDLQRARGMALSGRQDFAGWTQDERTQQAGVRIIDLQRYSVFADKDTENNGVASEETVAVRDLDPSLEFVLPPPEVRFRRNGTLASGSNDMQIVIRDLESGRERTVRVAFGGKSDIIR